MSWSKLNKTINAHSVIPLDALSCRDFGVMLPVNFPFNKVKFTCQALAMLSQLNDYDLKMVCADIIQICANPNATNSIKHSRNPLRRLWRTKYPFRNYHFLIEYSLKNNFINLEDILFDRQLQGAKDNFAAERTMLYEVQRLSNHTYDKAISKEEIREIQGAWKPDPIPVTRVNTQHAAVNGMQNELTKATWLMGTHLDRAYEGDGIKAYTLFHNPTDRAKLDLVECVFDKRLGTKSHNAQHLAAVLSQNNQQGKQVKWLAHSQGAIIFCAALEHYRIHYGKPLTGQQLAVHGSGSNVERLKRIAHSVGVKVVSVRNNPYDLVPNLAGRNDLSSSSLVRSMKFKGLVTGDDAAASPHTLPFLGLVTYADQLQMLGYTDKADVVRKFIKTLPPTDARL
ncbi:hypothetical protein [Pseudoalteromonas fuliginea]|uniref:Alpha/beta hydrolase n=1 Tax=Pseudoalteromonas fuliginea TaxID=1872678 RepID=A0ABD3YAZ5_9GAMM|nr:hypothetical protein [Pseudoalteromonas fuliginea]KDC51862.1 hypothetical protein DC53_06755 [Pseudoalteromonas fuliginea]KJZ27604.1 hypothetical protein TW82_11490 [Pseudoalteromonas fuliginea]